MIRRLTILLLSFLIASSICYGQTLRPGDVNNNGIVNTVDLLYWGVAFDAAGPPRMDMGTDWTDYVIDELWGQSFPDGTNYAYADCDGNGFVEEEDFDDAIDDNFGLSTGVVGPDNFVNGALGTAPKLVLEASETVVNEGATVQIDLSIDDTAQPIPDFYGIAFNLSYTTGILAGDDGPDFDLEENSWIEADNSYIQEYFFDNDGLGDAYFGVTRTNQITVPVQPSKVGTFSVVIEDIIVGLEIDTFELRIDSVLLLGGNGFTPLAVVPDTARIIVTRKPLDTNGGGGGTILDQTQTYSTSEYPSINIHPNPINYGPFWVQTDVKIRKTLLVDILGRATPLDTKLLKQGYYQFECPSRLSGLYWLQMELENADTIYQPIIFH